jgi:TatD DNase family protein
MNVSPFPLIDTHAHLSAPVFDRDRDDVLKRARSSGIRQIISVSEDQSDAERNLFLAGQDPIIRTAAGLYPANCDLAQAERMFDFIRRERENLIAIGEVGLDYWIIKEEPQREIQQHIFERFIKLSLELDLPLNVHSRSAGRRAISMLIREGAQKVQLHAFDGKAGSAQSAVEAGYLFSIPPSITRSRQKQKLVKKLPLSSMLLETDSPVLGPVPGERNEPSNITLSLQAVSEIKNLKKTEIIETIYYNTSRLYGTFGL